MGNDNGISARLDRIEAALTKPKSRAELPLRYAEVLVIPILVGVLAFTVSFGANRVAQGQLNLAERRAESEMEMRVMELAFDAVRDATTRDAGIALISSLDSHAATAVESWAIALGTLTPDEQATVRRQVNARVVAAVSEYKIQIFYDPDSSGQEQEANDVRTALLEAGVTSDIEVRPQRVTASSDQIRYYRFTERSVAEALKVVLDEGYSERRFGLQTVTTPSPGSVSIFLQTGS